MKGHITDDVLNLSKLLEVVVCNPFQSKLILQTVKFMVIAKEQPIIIACIIAELI